MPSFSRALLAAFAAVLSMSLVPVLIRISSANESTIGVVRLCIAILLVSLWVAWKQKLRLFAKQLSRKEWLGLVMVGVVFGLHWLLYFVSIKWSSAAVAAIAISTYGIHLLLLQWLVKKQTVRPLEWFAVVLCIAGCVLVAPNFSSNDKVTLGLLIGVVSGFLYACLPLLHQNLLHIPTAVRAWGQFLFASIIFLPLLPFANWNLSANDWWGLLVLGVVCTVIGHSLWVKSSSELPAIATSLMYYLYVPIAMTTSFLFLNETISTTMLLGAGCIISANVFVAVFSWYKLRLAKASV